MSRLPYFVRWLSIKVFGGRSCPENKRATRSLPWRAEFWVHEIVEPLTNCIFLVWFDLMLLNQARSDIRAASQRSWHSTVKTTLNHRRRALLEYILDLRVSWDCPVTSRSRCEDFMTFSVYFGKVGPVKSVTACHSKVEHNVWTV